MDGLTKNRPKSLTESFRSIRTRKLTIQGRSFMTTITLSLCKWNSNVTPNWKYNSDYDNDGEHGGPTLSLFIHWHLCDYHIPTYSPTYIKVSAVLHMLDRKALLRPKYHGLCLPTRLNMFQCHRVTSTVVPTLLSVVFLSVTVKLCDITKTSWFKYRMQAE